MKRPLGMSLSEEQNPMKGGMSREEKAPSVGFWKSRVCCEGNTWRIHLGPKLCEEELLGVLSKVISHKEGCQGELLRANKVRKVFKFVSSTGSMIVKHFLPKSPLKSLWYWFYGPQWRKEWKNLQEMALKGIAAPDPLFMAERRRMGLPWEGMVAFSEITGASNLREAFDQGGGRVEALLEELGCFVAQVHHKGVVHRDLHYDNVFVKQGDGPTKFFLLDFHRVKVQRAVRDRERVRNLAQLLGSIRNGIEKDYRDLFIEAYLNASGMKVSKKNLLSKIERLERRMAWRRERSRTKKCFKKSSLFCREFSGKLVVVKRRDVPSVVVDSILGSPRVVDAVKEVEVKKDRRTRVAFREQSDQEGALLRLCIKEYIPRAGRILSLGWGRKRAKRFWRGAWGLKVRGLPAPLVYAMWYPRFLSTEGLSGVVMERIEGACSLANYIFSLSGSPRALRDLSRSLASLLAEMHDRGVIHRDMKASNLLVRKKGDAIEIFLLDLEDVCFKKRTPLGARFRSLAQLDSSVPSSIGGFTRLRFLASYAQGKIGKEELKHWARTIRKLSNQMSSGGR